MPKVSAIGVAFCSELPLRIPGPPTETGPWRGKLRKCRAILRRRKSCRLGGLPGGGRSPAKPVSVRKNPWY